MHQSPLDPSAALALAPQLAEALQQHGYDTDSVADRLGQTARAALERTITIPADRALTSDDGLDQMIRLWLLQEAVPATALAGLPVEAMLGAGLLRAEGTNVRATIDIRPYASDDGASGWLASDLVPGLDHRAEATASDHVLGAGPASQTLTTMTVRTPCGSALDLGAGCGVQSLHLARHVERVVATDLNPRAVHLGRLTMALNGLDVQVRQGNLFEPVADERFDLIVSNPPYVMSPPGKERLVYREGSFTGDGLVRAVLTGAASHLTEGGMVQLLANWAITDQPWDERLAEWIEADPVAASCDAWVIEREQLDLGEYVEMWLADAGVQHQGPEAWARQYRTWLDYFDQLGIRGVGMGWMSLTRAGRDLPGRRFERWPWAVQQPVGPAFARAADDLTGARLPWSVLRSLRLHLVDDVTEESSGRPGASGFEHIVLRQGRALRRAIDASTELAAVLGACDGELTLGQIIEAVAVLLEVPASDLESGLAEPLRSAIEDGFLDAGPGGARYRDRADSGSPL